MGEAFRLLRTADPELWSIIGRSLLFSASAVLLAAIPGIPCGIAIGWKPGGFRHWLASIVHALSAVPTVVIGLFVYGLLSRTGPLGFLGMLYTPAAVILGQIFLALPLLVSFIAGGFSSIDPRFRETLETHAIPPIAAFSLALREARPMITTAIAMAFSRVIGEVGVAMMLGGNIRGLTRTMTTAIALDTSRGEFERAVALGIVLLAVALVMNMLIHWSSQTLPASVRRNPQ